MKKLKIIISILFCLISIQHSFAQYIEVKDTLPFPKLINELECSHKIDIHEDWAIVGCKGDPNLGKYYGSVLLYHKTNKGKWKYMQQLLSSVHDKFTWFGFELKIHAKYAIVSASHEENGGAFYIYKKDSRNIWNLHQKIKGNDIGPTYDMGGKIAFDGKTILASTWLEKDNKGNLSNRVINVYTENTSGKWMLEQTLKSNKYNLGTAIDIHNHTLILGATYHVSDSNKTSCAMIYEKINNNSWKQTMEINSGEENDFGFGWGVAIGEDFAACTSSVDSSVYIVEKNENKWSLPYRLNIPKSVESYIFGRPEISETKLILSGQLPSNDNSLIGVFKKEEKTNWKLLAAYESSTSVPYDFFAWSFAAYKEDLIIGSIGYDIPPFKDTGKLYHIKLTNK